MAIATVSNRSLITSLYSILTTDTELKSAFPSGNVALYDSKAPARPPFPYIVHSVAMGAPSFDPIVRGQYYISIFTKESGTRLCNTISARILTLLNAQIYSYPANGVGYINNYMMEGGGFVDTAEQDEKRYDLLFELHYSM